MITDSLNKARNLDRKCFVTPPTLKIEDSCPKKEIFLVQTFHQGNNLLQDIVTKNWDSITKHPHLKVFQNYKLTVANRRPKNLRDLLTSSTFVEKKINPSNKCWNPKLCRYCPILNRSGSITSRTTGWTIKIDLWTKLDPQAKNALSQWPKYVVKLNNMGTKMYQYLLLIPTLYLLSLM